MMHNKAAWQSVEKMAKCNRCGDEQVAWVKSAKGKWYLATAYVHAGGGFMANRLDPHFKHCSACICQVCKPSR